MVACLAWSSWGSHAPPRARSRARVTWTGSHSSAHRSAQTQLVQLLGRGVAGGAALALGRPERVGASPAQVVAVAGLGPADGARQPTPPAADQRPQQVLVAGVACRGLLVGVELGLHPGEGLLGEDCRDRHRDPVLLGPWGVALTRADRQQRRLAPAGRDYLGAVGLRPAHVG